MFATVNHLTLHYQIEGNPAGAPLVFINALGCDLRIWDHVVEPFRQHFRIIRYDKRGHGLSDVPTGPYAVGDHTADLSALLKLLEIGPATLIGLSVGGLIAMEFALQQPAGVQALVLCDTAPRLGTAQLWAERIQAVQAQGMAPLAGQILARWFRPAFARERTADYRGYTNMLIRTPVEGYTATCAALRDADLSEALPAIAAPTLVLCGADDLVVSPAQAREWAARLPKAQFEVIADAAHLPCIEQPEAMADAIRRFLREVDHV
jgi:3-oxoadipate enol-lactonase